MTLAFVSGFELFAKKTLLKKAKKLLLICKYFLKGLRTTEALKSSGKKKIKRKKSLKKSFKRKYKDKQKNSMKLIYN